jgi:hypothetical protein
LFARESLTSALPLLSSFELRINGDESLLSLSRHSSKARSGSIAWLFISFRNSENVLFGAKYVSRIIRTGASDFSAPNGIAQAIQTVTSNIVSALDSRRCEDLGKLIGTCSRHMSSPARRVAPEMTGLVRAVRSNSL